MLYIEFVARSVRKIKCDRALPECASCIRRSLPCAYVGVSKGKGKQSDQQTPVSRVVAPPHSPPSLETQRKHVVKIAVPTSNLLRYANYPRSNTMQSSAGLDASKWSHESPTSKTMDKIPQFPPPSYWNAVEDEYREMTAGKVKFEPRKANKPTESYVKSVMDVSDNKDEPMIREIEACDSCRKSHKKVSYHPLGQLHTQCDVSAYTTTILPVASDARSETFLAVGSCPSRLRLSPSKLRRRR